MFRNIICSKNIFRRNYVTSPPNTTAFDTHGFVKRLEQEGVPKQQAEGIMFGLSNVIDESVRNMAADMVSRAEHDRNHYTQKVRLGYTLYSQLTRLTHHRLISQHSNLRFNYTRKAT